MNDVKMEKRAFQNKNKTKEMEKVDEKQRRGGGKESAVLQ